MTLVTPINYLLFNMNTLVTLALPEQMHFTIQAIAGDASVTTSQRYVHPVPETIQRAGTTGSWQGIDSTRAKVAELADAPDLGSSTELFARFVSSWKRC